MSERIAIIVAMEREIAPLVSNWKRRGKPVQRADDGRDGSATTRAEALARDDKSIFARDDKVEVYCAGIGREAARQTAEVVVATRPAVVISAGWAGALTADLKVGDLVRPATVVDAVTGRSYATRDPDARGVLVTAESVLAAAAKREVAQRYSAQAVDMEAAAVAEVAQAAGVPFMAVKAISDASDFEMPPLDRFLGPEGKLDLLHLMGWACLRPRTWRALVSLGRNSRKAAEELARELERVLAECENKDRCR